MALVSRYQITLQVRFAADIDLFSGCDNAFKCLALVSVNLDIGVGQEKNILKAFRIRSISVRKIGAGPDQGDSERPSRLGLLAGRAGGRRR